MAENKYLTDLDFPLPIQNIPRFNGDDAGVRGLAKRLMEKIERANQPVQNVAPTNGLVNASEFDPTGIVDWANEALHPKSLAHGLLTWQPMVLPAMVGMGQSLTRRTKTVPNPQATTTSEAINTLAVPNISLEPSSGVHSAAYNPGTIRYTNAQNELWNLSPLQKVLQKRPFNVEVPNNPTYFSNIAEAFDNPKIPNKLSREQAMAVLKQPGVKAEEVKWSGINEFLNSKAKFTKDEIRKFIDDNNVDVEEITSDPEKMIYNDEGRASNLGAFEPKYAQYSLPGGDNYREVLLKWANKPLQKMNYSVRQGPNGWEVHNDLLGGLDADPFPTEVEARRFAERRNAANLNTSNPFQSSHFDEPNILAHFRLKDRTTPDGKKVLFVEEVQSDWQKALRRIDKSQADPTTTWDYKASKILHDKGLGEYAPHSQETMQQMNAPGFTNALDNVRASIGDVPNAPLARNYPELAMKRIMRMAAEQGYDAVGWTTGEQQAKRYSQAMLDNVDRLTYNPETQELRVFKNGQQIHSLYSSISGLPGQIGQEAAEKLINNLQRVEHTPDQLIRKAQLEKGIDRLEDFRTSWDEALRNYEPTNEDIRDFITAVDPPYRARWSVVDQYGNRINTFDTLSHAKEQIPYNQRNNWRVEPEITWEGGSVSREEVAKDIMDFAEGGNWHPTSLRQKLGYDPFRDSQTLEMYRRELSDLLKQNTTGELSGQDMVVGERGYSELYDKTLRNVADKIGKPHGARTSLGEVGSVPTYIKPKGISDELIADRIRAIANQPNFSKKATAARSVMSLLNSGKALQEALHFSNSPELYEALGWKKEGGTHTTHIFPITPSLRNHATTKGFPLYQQIPAAIGLGAGSSLAYQQYLANQQKQD